MKNEFISWENITFSSVLVGLLPMSNQRLGIWAFFFYFNTISTNQFSPVSLKSKDNSQDIARRALLTASDAEIIFSHLDTAKPSSLALVSCPARSSAIQNASSQLLKELQIHCTNHKMIKLHFMKDNSTVGMLFFAHSGVNSNKTIWQTNTVCRSHGSRQTNSINSNCSRFYWS